MAREHLSRRPYNLNADVWVYEDRCGLEIYSCTRRIGVIPWDKIRAALARYNKRRKPK